MKRIEYLQQEREKVFLNLTEDGSNRVKWLTVLMDIDDELEEMKEKEKKVN
jgi:hypothetical protein